MKKIIAILLSALMLASVLAMVPASAADAPARAISYYEGAYDTTWYNEAETTFTIDSAKKFDGIGYLMLEGVSFKGKTLKLTTDVVYNGGTVEQFIAAEKKFEFNSFGKGMVTFMGTFDGQGHVISGLYSVRETTSNGIFSMASGATIKNIVLVNSYFSNPRNGGNCNTRQDCGTIVGKAENGTVIQNCFSNAVIAAAGFRSGGIVGYAIGGSKVEGCVYAGDIKASGRGIGGIVGASDSEGLTIKNCINLANIYNAHGGTEGDCHTSSTAAGQAFTGGIIGQLKNGAVVTHCINLGNVSSDSIAYGGWVGASKPKDQQENPIYGPDAIYTTNAFNENTIAGIGEAESSYVDYCYVIRASDCIDGGTTPFIGHYYTATPKEHNGYIESTTDIIGAAATTVLTNLDFTNAWATVENGVPMPKAVAGYVAAAQSTDYTAANPNPVPDQVTGTTGGGSSSDEDDEPSLDDLLNDAANDGNYSKDKTDETTAAPEATTEAKKGCKGAIATGAILVTVSALGLGAVVAKKKED